MHHLYLTSKSKQSWTKLFTSQIQIRTRKHNDFGICAEKTVCVCVNDSEGITSACISDGSRQASFFCCFSQWREWKKTTRMKRFLTTTQLWNSHLYLLKRESLSSWNFTHQSNECFHWSELKWRRGLIQPLVQQWIFVAAAQREKRKNKKKKRSHNCYHCLRHSVEICYSASIQFNVSHISLLVHQLLMQTFEFLMFHCLSCRLISLALVLSSFFSLSSQIKWSTYDMCALA